MSVSVRACVRACVRAWMRGVYMSVFGVCDWIVYVCTNAQLLKPQLDIYVYFP